MTLPPDQRAGPALWLGVAASALLVLGFVVWGHFVPMAGAVIAPGQVGAPGTAHPVQHGEGGRVADLAVVEGQQVSAGDLLLRLDGSADAPEWDLILVRAAELTARIARLAAERDGVVLAPPPNGADASLREAWRAQAQLFEARAETLARQVAQLAQRRQQAEAELAGLVAQADALRSEAALVAEDRTRQDTLVARGLTPTTRAASLARDAARLRGSLAGVEARQAEVRGLVAEITLQAETLETAHRAEAEAERQVVEGQRLELAARQAQLAERRVRRTLRAPVAGRVHALAVAAPGAVLNAGATVLSIIPADPVPEIRLRLHVDDIDRVGVGQSVRLHFPALAPQGGEDLAAQITDISAAAVTDETSGVRFFPVTVTLTDEGRAELGRRGLVPGMAVQGFIATAERTPLEYLLGPIRDQMARALHEP